MLLNQAIIQTKVNDYLGSEIASLEAISILKSLGENKQLYLAYNNLGVIYNNLGNYSKSLHYHKIAQSFNKDLSNPYYEITSLNNIGVVYKNLEQYQEAIRSFEDAIGRKGGMNSRLQAKLTDNLGHAHILSGNFDKGYLLIREALDKRMKLDHKGGIVMSNIHHGDYYRLKDDKRNAIRQYSKAAELADSLNMQTELLDIYLSLVEVDKSNETKYLRAHIDLTDKIVKEERSIQNQFARIRYETDQFIKRADSLNQQKTSLIIGIILVLMLFFLTYIIQRQNSRNKKLVLEKQQKDSNERIYELLLNSQQQYEEGSVKERKRISRDLHDSILSKFFGVRINLEVLNNKIGKDSEEKRTLYLESLKGIENEIRNISHKLNTDYNFSDIGFLDILKDLFQEHEESHHLKIKFSSGREINWNVIKNNIKINFYRIIQESLQNIRKHAKAKNVEIRIDFEEDYLILHISDDGQGFDVKNKEKGIGLKNIRERVKEIQGKFDIISNESGTILIMSVPKEEVYDGYYKSFNGR